MEGRGNFRPMYRQDVSYEPTNIIKEKSKLTKPIEEKTWIAQMYQFYKRKHTVSLNWFMQLTAKSNERQQQDIKY